MRRIFPSPPLFNVFFTAAALFASAGFAACSAPPANGQAAQDPSAIAPVAAAAAAETFTGAVVETMDSGGYTYMRLQADGKDVWIAATEFTVTKGERLTVPLEMPMADFHSATLNRDFPMIYFVSRVGREGQTLQSAANPASGLASMPMASHESGAAAAQGAAPMAVVPNAPPAGGLSIAETWAKRVSLAGKAVTVRGTVVKANDGIMGFNWFHLQDGTGQAADGTNDLTVTTDALVKVGDVVTVSGTLAIDKDFGAGYSYRAILEKATVK